MPTFQADPKRDRQTRDVEYINSSHNIQKPPNIEIYMNNILWRALPRHPQSKSAPVDVMSFLEDPDENVHTGF
jgi:hypothetical protein